MEFGISKKYTINIIEFNIDALIDPQQKRQSYGDSYYITKR